METRPTNPYRRRCSPQCVPPSVTLLTSVVVPDGYQDAARLLLAHPGRGVADTVVEVATRHLAGEDSAVLTMTPPSPTASQLMQGPAVVHVRLREAGGVGPGGKETLQQFENARPNSPPQAVLGELAAHADALHVELAPGRLPSWKEVVDARINAVVRDLHRVRADYEELRADHEELRAHHSDLVTEHLELGADHDQLKAENRALGDRLAKLERQLTALQ